MECFSNGVLLVYESCKTDNAKMVKTFTTCKRASIDDVNEANTKCNRG